MFLEKHLHHEITQAAYKYYLTNCTLQVMYLTSVNDRFGVKVVLKNHVRGSSWLKIHNFTSGWLWLEKVCNRKEMGFFARPES